jgi:cytochrome c-type biogenesis protein CcmH/NrfG
VQVVKTLQNLADLYIMAGDGVEKKAEPLLRRIIQIHTQNVRPLSILCVNERERT